MNELITALANMGFGAIMSGLMALFLWHLIKVTIPKMHAEHREERAVDRAECRKERTEDRQHDLKIIEDQGRIFQDAVKAICLRLESMDAVLKSTRDDLVDLKARVGWRGES